MKADWDVIIAGGGAAGLSAALLLGRSRRRVVVVDAGEPRNRFAAHMHGVLGHEGVDPRRLVEIGRAEAAGYGVEFTDGAITATQSHADSVGVTLADGTAMTARALIVATGVRDELPPIPGLAELWGTAVLHCPYCHGWEVRDRRLGVINTTPMALHQVQLVRQWSDRVTFFSAGVPDLDGEAERRLRARDIELVDSPVVEVLAAHRVMRGVRTADGAIHELDAVFTASRMVPRDDVVAGLGLARDETPFGGYLTVDATGRTSDPRIWAIGNVSTPMATVPLSIAAGVTAATYINMVLVDEEFDTAAELASAR